jgi:predicted TIM-barrel fold metal-dependent hydrolase
MSVLEKLAGRIRDVDSHECTPAPLWSEVFGEASAPLAEYFTQTHEPKAMNSFNPGVLVDDLPITAETLAEGWGTAGHAPGAFDMQRRVEVLDLVGVAESLVFPTGPGLLGGLFLSTTPAQMQRVFGVDVTAEQLADTGRALQEGYNDWCIETAKVSPRLRPVAYIDTSDLSVAMADIERVIAGGLRAVHLCSGTLPGGYSPGHPNVDPLWELLESTNTAVLLHVGGDFGLLASDEWANFGFKNAVGKQLESPEFAHDPYTVAQFNIGVQNYVTLLVYGGVFERFPALRVGCIETGAYWLGPMAENLDIVGQQFKSLMRKYSLKPSEFIQRNVRVSPFFWEPIDTYIDRYGFEDVYVFGSDYPHYEGGKNPMAIYDAALDRLGPAVAEKFFVENARLLMP